MERLRPTSRTRFSAAVLIVVGGFACEPHAGPSYAPDATRDVVTLGGRDLVLDPAVWTTLESVASVGDAGRLGTGWALLDGRASSLHLLSDGESRARSLARQGDGPGELRAPEALARTTDTMWVARVSGDHLDGFTAEGFVRRVRLGGPPCPGGLIQAAAGAGSEVALALQCLSRAGARRLLGRADPATGVVTWEPFGPDPEASSASEGLADGVVSLDRMALAAGPDGATLGRALSGRPCVWVGADGAPGCLTIHDRPTIPADLRDEMRRAALPGLRRLGLDLAESIHEPFLWRLYATPAGWLVARTDGAQLVLEPFASEPPWRVRLPEGVDLFQDGGAVLLTREGMAGTEVARLTLDDLIG